MRIEWLDKDKLIRSLAEDGGRDLRTVSKKAEYQCEIKLDPSNGKGPGEPLVRFHYEEGEGPAAWSAMQHGLIALQRQARAECLASRKERLWRKIEDGEWPEPPAAPPTAMP